MARPNFLWITAWIAIAPFTFAADDPTVEELWAQRYSSEAARDRLYELGPETRELAHRILHPSGEVFAKWPTSGDSDLIESMRADAVPEIILALRNSVDTDDRVTLMRQLESLGRMARPAADTLMTIALEEDGPEREAALRALAATGEKRDFLIGEAIHMMSVAGSSRSVQIPMVGPDRIALVGTWLLKNIQDDRARTALVRAAHFHPSAAVRESALSSLSDSAWSDKWLARLFIDCLDDHSATGSGFAGSGSPSSMAYRAILQYHELPADASTGLIERLYRQSYEASSGYEWLLAEAIVKCPTTDAHAAELVNRKLRPLLDEDAYFHKANPKNIRVAAASVVLHWNPKDEMATRFLAGIVEEVNNKNFFIGLPLRDPDVRAWAAEALGRLGPDAKGFLPLLHRVMDRGIDAEKYSQLANAAAWAIAEIDQHDTTCLPVFRRFIDYDTQWSELDRVLGPRAAMLVDIDEVLTELQDPQFVLDTARWEDSVATWMPLRPHHDVIIPVLLEYLKSERIDVRIATVGILGHKEFAPDTLIPNITELLDDRYASVRAAAAEALAEFGPTAAAAIPKLERATQDRYLTVKLAAEDALRDIRSTPQE